jgi:multidrug efflux pump subunit AcrB
MLLMFGAMGLAAARMVPLKMLPFDNKNEFQIVIDMPEGTTLEVTDAVTAAFGDFLRTVPEVTDFQTYAGTASAMDFNGMVRQYYLREGAHVADLRVNLVHKKDRKQQSHELILRLRNDLERIAREWNANIKLVELPAGPPVVATVVAEIYGRPDQSYAALRDAAEHVRRRLELEAGVVDVDTSIEADQDRYLYRLDKEKAALSGVSTEQAARTLELALSGRGAGILRVPEEVNPLRIELRLPRALRSSLEDLRRVYVRGESGHLVTLGEIGAFETLGSEKSIYHKNLERVVYVFAETAGRAPAEAILDIQADRTDGAGGVQPNSDPRPADSRTFLRPGADIPWSVPEGIRVVWSGEGEWDITLGFSATSAWPLPPLVSASMCFWFTRPALTSCPSS